MYQHEIYTASASDAREMASAFDGEVNSYNIAPDEEMFIVSIINRFNHKRMMSLILKVTPAYDFEEVITNKL